MTVKQEHKTETAQNSDKAEGNGQQRLQEDTETDTESEASPRKPARAVRNLGSTQSLVHYQATLLITPPVALLLQVYQRVHQAPAAPHEHL